MARTTTTRAIPPEDLTGPINTVEQVEKLVQALCGQIRTSEDKVRLELEGLYRIRSLRMQLHFKQAFATTAGKIKLETVHKLPRAKTKKPEHPKGPPPVRLPKEEYLNRMLGKPLSLIAARTDKDVNELLHVIRPHGNADKDKRTLLRPHHIPLLLNLFPEVIDEEVAKRTITGNGVNDVSSPSKILMHRNRARPGKPGNYFKLLFNRSKY